MLIKFLMQYFILIFVLIWYLYHIAKIKQKPFIKLRHSNVNARMRAEKAINAILIVTIFVFYFAVGFSRLYLQTKDIPIICSGSYEYVEGYVLNTAAERRYNSKNKKFLSRTIIVGNDIESAVGTEIYIPDNANKGDYVKCYYLPNSHFGYIVERTGNEEND